MQVVSSESIILRERPFRERDRLVTFLARDKGRLTGVAKGVRKLTSRGVGSFEPFTRGVVFYVEGRRSELVTIRKCDPRPPYLYLQNDYDKILYATYITEWVELSSPGPDDAEALFALLAGALERIAAAPPERLPLLRLETEVELVRVLGLQPGWSRCVQCGARIFERREGQLVPRRPAPHQFDVGEGGVRCPDCTAPGPGRHRLAPGTLAVLAAWRRHAVHGEGEPVAPRDEALAELGSLLEAHLAHHLERRPRSLAMLPRWGAPAGAPAG